MTESILSILRHILRGEKIIKEREEKEKSGETASASGSTSTSNAVGRSTTGTERRDDSEADVNQENLRQLMDMGFSRAHCVEALMHTLTVEQATDYLLNNPATHCRTVSLEPKQYFILIQIKKKCFFFYTNKININIYDLICVRIFPTLIVKT